MPPLLHGGQHALITLVSLHNGTGQGQVPEIAVSKNSFLLGCALFGSPSRVPAFHASSSTLLSSPIFSQHLVLIKYLVPLEFHSHKWDK